MRPIKPDNFAKPAGPQPYNFAIMGGFQVTVAVIAPLGVITVDNDLEHCGQTGIRLAAVVIFRL